MSEDPIGEALARLDADLAAAEARVADLKLKRQGALAFLAYLDEPVVRPRVARRPTGSSSSPSVIVEGIIKEARLTEFDTKQINSLVSEAGYELTRTQVSNALTYLRRQMFLDNGARRGQWRRLQDQPVSDPETPSGPTEVRPLALAPSPLSSEAGAG
jgi:hypothetical protein